MVLTRRALLAGAALAPLGCRAQSTAIPGGFVYPSMARGHLIRTPPEAPTVAREVPIVIAGAGVAGLAAAWWLRRHGREDFVVLDLEDRAGGTAAATALGGHPCPLGAHYVPAPRAENVELVALLREVGAIVGADAAGEPIYEETFLTADPEERVFYGGAWYEGLIPKLALTRRDEASFAKFRARVDDFVRFRDAEGRRAFTLPLAECSRDPKLLALDQMSMAAWLEGEGLGGEVFRWWVEYGARDDFGAKLEDVSAWAALHYFAARVRVAGGESAEFLTWPEGNGFLVRHLAAAIGDERILGGQVVRAVTPREGGVELLVQDAESRETSKVTAKRAILATPSFVRARLVEGGAPYAPETSPWLVANLLLREHPGSAGYAPAWDNVLYDSPSLGYVSATHQRLKDHGSTVLTYYWPLCDAAPKRARDALAALSFEDATKTIVADLARAHDEGFARLVERVEIARYGHAMVRPAPGTVWGGARERAALPQGNLHFAHSDLSALPLFEEAFFHGVRAAKEILAA